MLDEYKQDLEGFEFLQIFANMQGSNKKRLPNGETIQGRMSPCGGKSILLSKEHEEGYRIEAVIKPHSSCDPVKCTRDHIFACNKGKKEPIHSAFLDCNQPFYNN